MMDDADRGQYERTKIRRAKRLVAEYLSRLDSLAKKGPDEAELLRKEKERIAALVVGRRQREAKLVGDFDSDEIYDPDDEGVLSMREAQQESRRRIRALCVGRKLADCTTLLIDDLVRELQAFMTSCSLFVGLVQPGRNAAEVICPSLGARNVEAVVRRDGNVQVKGAQHAEQSITTTVVDGMDTGPDTIPAKKNEDRTWESTATGSGQLPNPDIIFKCIDTERAVVVGSTVDERGGRYIGLTCPDETSVPDPELVGEVGMGAVSDKHVLPDRLTASSSLVNEEEASQNNRPASRFLTSSSVESTRGAGSKAGTSAAVAIGDDGKGEGDGGNDDQHQISPTTKSPTENQQQPPQPAPLPPRATAIHSRQSAQGVAAESLRPQVWVPLTGAGDSGCIGMIGVQGFTTGTVVDDKDWRDWFMHRMKPLHRGENRNLKRLRLVRPRGLPDKGILEHVPTGVAAKVVYGSVEKISRKRGMPVYAVRWEDGLLQLDVPKRYMHQFIAEDDARAGKGIPLSADVVQHLTWIGSTVGPVLDEVNKAIHLNSLAKVTLAEDARHRDVVEQALRSLIECLPSIDAAEVWQLDNDGGIRCVQGLAAAGQGQGKIYRSNERVTHLLHEEDIEDFRLQMEPVPVDVSSGNVKDETKNGKGKSEKNPTNGTKIKPATSVNIPEGLVIRPKRTLGILAAAPFRDYSFKLGTLWIGADRLARGFALVLRGNVKNRGRGGPTVDQARGGSLGGGGITRHRWSGGWSTAAGTPTEAGHSVEGRYNSNRNGHIEDGDFAARVSREVGVALACVRGRERRAAVRVQALKKLSSVCLKDRPSGKEAKETVLAEIATVLPGCRAYIGVLQPGGHKLIYESATANSAMKGRELRRGEGISLHYLDDPQGQIRVIQHRDGGASGAVRAPPEPPSLQASAKIGGSKPPNFSVGDRVEVWYASSWLCASIIRVWGHQCYDVRYEEFRETEAGVPGWRLRQVVTLEHLNVKVSWQRSSEETYGGVDDANDDGNSNNKDIHSGNGPDNTLWPWPFVCVPLRSAGNRVGVLGVDGWSDVELGRPEEVHPEKAVVNFLRETGSLLANALYTERRDRGLSALGKTLRGQDTTQNGALEALIMLLRETVTFRTRIDVLETRAADPGAFFCRGTWQQDSPQPDRQEGGQGRLQRQTPVRVFDVSAAPRVEELCLTPAQMKRLIDRHKTGSGGGGGLMSPQKKQEYLLLKEITPYQREMHLIARDGPGAKNGLQARALTTTSRRGEIVGRFQRLLVRAGGGRPSADGWFLVRVGRSLPEDSMQESSAGKSAKAKAQLTASRQPNTSTESSEDGDIWLLSEMCRKLEVGFMAIASREQRAVSRMKALDRVLNCCKGFNVAAASSRSFATGDHARDRIVKTAERSTIVEAGVSRTAAVSGASSDAVSPAARYGDGQSQPKRTEDNVSSRCGKPFPQNNAVQASGASAFVKSTSSIPVVPTTASSAATSALSPKELEVSLKPFLSDAATVVAEEGRTSKVDEGLVFSTPFQPPTPAETSDGRKGALVTLKDARLAVLVYQGDKRVGVVEQPGGRQQVVPESEVVPGQSVFLRSGREALLVETTKDSNALVVVGTGGKANVVEETTKGNLTKLPLSVLKDFEAVAALAAGEGAPRAVTGVEVVKQVIAAAQWVLPQVDIYFGDLSPFGESLNFTIASSRSNASGNRIFRHSKPNGGATFGVADEPNGDKESNHDERDQVQSASWDVIDTCKHAVVPGIYGQGSSRMHFFSDPLQQGWPWVAVPIRPGPQSRAVRGVLCVDRFEDPWADEETVLGHPEKDVLTYLETCATALGLALDLEAKICALRELRAMEMGDGTGGTAASMESSTTGSASLSALGDFGGGPGKGSSVQKTRAEMSGEGVRNKPVTISSAQDVFAAVTTALSRALVHCKRFEVWEAVQPCDEQGRFYLEPSRAGKPPPFQAEDGDTREFLKLQITHCTGLAKADRFGLSDPFCIVKWPRNNQELGRTPTVYNTVHPMWKACFFEVPLHPPTPAAPAASALGEDSSHSACRSSCGGGSSGAGWEQEESEDETLELTIQVWDEDDGAPADFLGELHFNAQALLDMARDRRDMLLPLEVKRDGSMTKKQRELVKGSVGLRVSPATDGALSRLQESIDVKKVFLEVIIQGSLGLRQGDSACLFAIATLDGKDVGKTAAMPNGSDPVWMETVRIEISRDRLRSQAPYRQSPGDEGLVVADDGDGNDVPPSEFSIIVWNRVQEQGPSRRLQCLFVGRVDLSVAQLVECTREGGGAVGDDMVAKLRKTHHVPLKDRDGNFEEGCVLLFSVRETSPSAWREGMTEAASIGDSYADAESVEASGLKTVFERRVRLTVLRATGLAQADGNGVADPMCVLRRRGREVGRTTTIYGSLEPVWGTKIREGESFLLTIPHPREAAFGGGGVVIEVFDEDFGDPKEFLGQVCISGEELLRFHSPGTFEGPDAQNRQVSLQKKPEVALSEQWLVQGELFYRLEGVDSGDEEPEDAVVVDLPRILDQSLQPAEHRGGASVPLQSSQYRRLEIRVIEARGLAKADRFGLSDPYVVIYANGQTELGRTRTIPLSLEPVWTNPEERFVVAVGFEDAAKCDLTLEVWDDDHLGQGDFLGQVYLPKVELLEYNLPTGPMECELDKKKEETPGFNELVQGVLTFSIREAYSDMPDEPADGEGSGGQVSLTVLSAKGLAKADVFGKSDPFAIVLLNRREVGRTRTLFKTLDPCWTEPRETFPLRIVGNRDRCSVAVQLWDEDLGRCGDFLGQASLGWADLELLPGEASRELNLTLGYRDGVPKRDQELVQGTIQMLVEAPAIEAKIGDGVARSYIVTVDRAWGLAKADRFGKADPFVSIKVNADGDEHERGRTIAIAGTLQPIWRNPPEVFILTAVEELILEVWDLDYLKKGDFLGEVRLSMQDLAEQVPVDGAHEFAAALRPKSSASDKFNRLVQGSLRFTCQDWMSPDRLVLEGLGEKLKLTVVSATGLPSGHHFGLADPLACVRWNGLEVGRTRVVKKSSSPAWDEGFQISVPLESTEVCRAKGTPGNPEVEVVVEILDAGAGESITAPTTVAGTRSGMIGRIVLGERALRLPGPGDGPPCKVFELPIELSTSTSTKTAARGRRKHVYSGVSNPGTIILFLERLPSPTSSSQSQGVISSSSTWQPADPSTHTIPVTPAEAAAKKERDASATATTNGKNNNSGSEKTAGAAASVAQTPDVGRSEQQAPIQLWPQGPPAREKMQLKVFSAWGLALGAKALDVVVTVTACGRRVGTTHVSSIGGTTSPEWIDEGFILPVEMCAVLFLEVWGRKMGNQDTFLGRASLRSTRQDIEKMTANGEPLELPLRRKSPKVLPLEDQTQAKGHLLFSLFPWHDFDYAGELDKSNASRSLQVQVRLVGATNLTEPSASIFATFSFRGTELSKTGIIKPTLQRVPTGDDPDGYEVGAVSNIDGFSHVWLTQQSNSTCTVPLPEACVDRRETEIEIDLWEEGGTDKEHGDHLGQRSHGNTKNLAARGSLSFQLWLRRGGESLASEFIHSAVAVEVLVAKGLPSGPGSTPSGRRRAFCVVKEDGTEIGRTQESEIVSGTGDNTNVTQSDRKASSTITGLCSPEMASWEGENHRGTNLFAVTLSPHRGGGLPLQLTVELWEIVMEGDGSDPLTSSRASPGPGSRGDRRTMKSTSLRVDKQPSTRRIGSTRVGPDTLLLSLPGRLTLPLELSPTNPTRTICKGEGMGSGMYPGRGVSQTPRSGGRAARANQPETVETAGSDPLSPRIVLRVTPQVGVHWGRRVKAAAVAAKRVDAPPTPGSPKSSAGATVPPTTDSGSNGLAHVVYMTNAEGSARTWRAPVTPGSSIPAMDYEDVLELVFGSVPACCPQAPALLVAPISDIGVQIGQVWIGPKIAARHAIVAHRPHSSYPSNGNQGDEEAIKEESSKETSAVDVGSIVAVEPPREDELFMRMVAAEAEGFLRKLRASDMRVEQRRMALDRVREICETWTQARANTSASPDQRGTFVYNVDDEQGERCTGVSSKGLQEMTSDGVDYDGDSETHREVSNGKAGHGGDEAEGITEGRENEEDEDEDEDDDALGGRAYGDLYRGVLRALEMALPGVSIYLGLLERGGESIRFVACTRQSSMAGKRLRKGEGISFCCVGPHYAPYIVYPRRRSGGPKRGHIRGIISQPQQLTQREEDGLRELWTPEVSSRLDSTMADVVDAATKGRTVFSARSERLRAEKSLEEIVVSIQKVFRGKSSRARIGRSRQLGVSQSSRPSLVPRNAHNKSNASASLIPKVFDYEGRVGWPFVCVPLEGFLRSSSIGVFGLDTFEQMGDNGNGKGQPEAGVVQMVQEAARALGNTICCDRRRRALNAVAQSCLSFKATLIDVLVATAKAAEESVISASQAEVWKVDPSDGSLYVVTMRLPEPTDPLRVAQLQAQRPSLRQLKVEVTAAELLPAITDYYETLPPAAAGPVRAIRSVAVRIATAGEGTRSKTSVFRTAPFPLKPLARSCSPQWHEDHRHLMVTMDSTFLRAEIIAKMQRGTNGKVGAKKDFNKRQRRPQRQQAPPAEGLLSSRGRRGLADLGDDELILASASIDVNAVREGYNYIQLFSPQTPEDDEGGSTRSGGGDNPPTPAGDKGKEGAGRGPSVPPRGKLWLRLGWVEPGGGGGGKCEAGVGAGHTTLVVHGASGLAKADFVGDSDPYCIVKWGGVELGRTKTCPNTHEPDWGKERFRLALPDEGATDEKDRFPLVLEVWDEDAPGAKGDFLGQVVLQTNQLEAPAPGTRRIVLSKKPAAELKLSKQKFVQGMIEFSLETRRATSEAEATVEEAAASGAGEGGNGTQIDTRKPDRSKTQTAGRVTPSKGGASSRSGAKAAPFAISTAGASKEEADVEQGTEAEWEGVTWDEGDVPEAESLGSVSASLTGAGSASLGTAGSITLGTVELASNHEDSTEPQDVLICLKGVAGLREAQMFGQSSVFCVVEVGNREVDRTRPLKHARELVWEKPEERFRVAMEDVEHAISAQTPMTYSTAGATSAVSTGVSVEKTGASTVSNEGKEGAASSAPSEEGTGVSMGESNDTEGPSLLSTPTLALGQAQRDYQNQQQVMVPASSLTVSVWSKSSGIGGQQDNLLGRATVPARFINRPPGDVWLPLAGASNSTTTTATAASGGEVAQKGVTRDTPVREDAHALGLGTVSEPSCTDAVADNADAAAGKKGGGAKWGGGLFRRKPKKISGTTKLAQHQAEAAASVRVWLGKERRGSLRGQQPGNGHIILRVHGASALRKADRHGSSDPKCFVVWNSETAGSTSTVYNTTDPCWDPDKEAFCLRLPLDRSLCNLQVDVWDMNFLGTRKGDFLGRATVPTVMLLHPPPGGIEATITVPLLPSKGPSDPQTANDGNGVGTVDTTAEAAEGDDEAAFSGKRTNAGPQSPAAIPDKRQPLHGGGVKGTEHFATRMIHNVQKRLRMDETITGTLTVSLELFQYGDQDEGLTSKGVREPGAPPLPAEYAAAKFKVAEDAGEARRRREREGIRVPRMLSRVTELHDKLEGAVVIGPAAAGFSDMTEGAAAVIPETLAGQILSLARRGSRGPGHTVLNANRNDGLARDRLVVLLQPIPAVGHESDGENDRGVDGDPSDNDAERSREIGAAVRAVQGVRRRRQRQQANAGDVVAARADERPRHALVLPCVPGQISKEDIAVATELARAADEAGRTIQRRQRRQVLMDRCAENIEKLCRSRTQCYEGLYSDVLSALNPVCCGAGAEVGRPLRDMPVILSTLTCGGYRLRVETSSPGWSMNADHQHSAAPVATGGAEEWSLCSTGGVESVGRWSGPLPMASGLVKRAVDAGDIFLVIQGTVYVANVSWSGIWQETMPHKHVSSSAALKTSVALLREGIGPEVSGAFVLAPLWVPGVGCVGLITIADVPYARPQPAARGGDRRRNPASHRHRQEHGGEQAPSGRTSRKRAKQDREGEEHHAVGPGVVEFARRVGVALGTAVFRLKKKSLLARITVEGARYSLHGGKGVGEHDVNQRRSLASPPMSPLRQAGPVGTRRRGASAVRNNRGIEGSMDASVATQGRRHVSGESPPRDLRPPDRENFNLSGWDSLEMTSVLRWPCPYEAVCNIYSAAIVSLMEGLPWVRAADVWHISSILDNEAVFTPEAVDPNIVAGDTNAAGVETESIGTLTVDSGRAVKTQCGDAARFCERVIGKTWSGYPVVVLRSLRVPARDEAACTARWLRGNGEDGGGVFGDDEGWTDQRLRLLADEWRVCSAIGDGDRGPGLGSSIGSLSASPGASPRSVPRPFMVHTGHVIVPFSYGCVWDSEDDGSRETIGHGVVLAVDRGVDWRRWESHIIETAATARRCFERLERDGEVVERERVRLWKEKLLDDQTRW